MADNLLALLRGAPRIRSRRLRTRLSGEERKAAIQLSSQKRQLERETDFQDNYNRGVLPNANGVANGFNVALETLLPSFNSNFPGVAVATLNGKVVYREGLGPVSGNWKLLRKQLGKSSSFYHSPWWSIVTNYNKLEGGVVTFASRQYKGISDQDVMLKSEKNRPKNIQRRENYLRGNAGALEERLARLENLSRSIGLRSEYLRSLGS